MPESRPLSSLRASYFDIPPATADTALSYPDRHTSLRRALRNTTDLARDASQGGNSAFGPAIDSPRNATMSFLRRARRRIRESTRTEYQTEDDNADDAPEARSSKRRRLNPDTHRPAKGAIKYGRYGQVETGRLRMEIVSNDGGEHKDPRHPGIFLGASNILKMDKSVFCSERTSAGIVLKHADNTPFCLEKLHIVGPEHGFTAPVREGIVYVAMDMEDLRLYQDPPFHARRSGIHEPPYNHSRYRNIRASPERLTLSDALRDPEIANGRFSPIPREPEDPPDEESYYDADYLRQADPEFHCDIPSPPADSLQTSFSESSVPFTVLSDEEPEVEDVSPQEVLDYRLQRMRRMPRRHDPDNLDREDGWSNADPMGGFGNAWSQSTNRLETLMARARPYHSPSPDDMPPDDRRGPVERSKVPPPGFDDPSVSTAIFYIKRGKSRIAIKFDAPVSGRYILLKLWANRSNVDVQSVIAKGYAGPRFFPAVELV